MRFGMNSGRAQFVCVRQIIQVHLMLCHALGRKPQPQQGWPSIVLLIYLAPLLADNINDSSNNNKYDHNDGKFALARLGEDV